MGRRNYADGSGIVAVIAENSSRHLSNTIRSTGSIDQNDIASMFQAHMEAMAAQDDSLWDIARFQEAAAKQQHKIIDSQSRLARWVAVVAVIGLIMQGIQTAAALGWIGSK